MHQLIGVFHDALDVDDKPVIGLVGGMFPIAARRDDQPRVAALGHGVHHPHRRAKVADVQASLQVLRQLRIDKIHNNRAPLPSQIDPYIVVRQIDDDASLAGVAAPEIDIAQTVSLVARARFGELLAQAGARRSRRGRAALEGDQHRLAVYLRVITQGAAQFQDHARAPTGLHHIDSTEITTSDVLDAASEGIRRVREIESNTRRIVDGKPGGRIRGRVLERHSYDDRAGGLRRYADRLDAVGLCPGRRAGGGDQERRAGNPCLNRRKCLESHFLASCYSCSCRLCSFSSQLPPLSCTISLSSTADSVTFTMRPKFCPR